MVPDVAEDAESVSNFKRQSNSLTNANRPSVLARLYFLKAPPGRQFFVIQELVARTYNRSLGLFTESFIGFFESAYPLELRYAKNHFSAAFQVSE